MRSQEKIAASFFLPRTEDIMACFLVPLAEGIILTGAKKLFGQKETARDTVWSAKNVFAANVGVLQKMLFGGSFLLAIEHIYHGEVVLYPPFLTAMSSPEDTAEMLHEMATVGVSMALLLTAVWAAACGLIYIFGKGRKNALCA